MAKAKDSVRDDMKAKMTPEAEEARFWLAEIEWAKKEQKDWLERGKKIVERYMDERGEYTERDIAKPQRRLNLLWANVETIGPALLSRAPTPNVTLANKDKNPVGRWAAIVLERVLAAELRDDDYMSSLTEAVRDMLLPGRGTVWVEYGADVDGDDDDAQVTKQDCVVRYVHWQDFLTNRARNWSEVTWISKRAFLDREQLITKYGEKIGKQITLDHKPEELRRDPVTQQQFSKATVWQIFDSKTRQIIEVSPGYKGAVLAKRDPVVKFDKFYPAPRPLYATLGGKSLIPTPDYVQYQDQAEEIDQLTNRIHGLTKALRLRGFYDQSFTGLAQAFNDANDNELVPVESYVLFREKGGIEGTMVWIPLKDVIVALQGAYDARDKAKQSLYEITGLSDIIRGATEPTETYGAQQLKSQYGSLRIRDRQQDIQRIARDVIRMMADVICQHYTMETLQEMSGVKLLTRQQLQAVQGWQQMMAQRQQMQQQLAQQQPQGAPPPQTPPPPPPPVPQDLMEVADEPTWDDVYALLKNGQLRKFVIDVETDSTIEPDQNAEREGATQFLTGITQYVGAWAQVLPAAPELAPLCGEMLSFAARKWKIGETLETKIEEAAKLIEEKANQPPPPDPKMAAERMKAQAEGAKTQGTIQTSKIKAVAEQTKAQLGVAQAVAEHHAGMAQMQQESVIAQQQHAMDMQKMQQEAALAAQQPQGPQE